MVHHGDEKVEQNNDVDDGEGAEHEEAEKPGELFDACQLEVVQVDEAENGPEKGLDCLPQTENKKKSNGTLVGLVICFLL